MVASGVPAATGAPHRTNGGSVHPFILFVVVVAAGIIAFQSPLLDLPSFTLRQEHVFDKIGAVFGWQDIDFASHPAFSRRYLLRAEDESAVRALFTNALLSFYDKSKGLCTEGDGETFIFYRPSKRVSPKQIMAFMQEGFAVFGLMKGRV